MFIIYRVHTSQIMYYYPLCLKQIYYIILYDERNHIL